MGFNKGLAPPALQIKMKYNFPLIEQSDTPRVVIWWCHACEHGFVRVFLDRSAQHSGMRFTRCVWESKPKRKCSKLDKIANAAREFYGLATQPVHSSTCGARDCVRCDKTCCS